MSEVDGILERVHATLSSLPDDASLGSYAGAIAELGLPTWFGRRSGLFCTPLAPRGTTQANLDRAFTKDQTKLRSQKVSADANAVMFDVCVQGQAKLKFVFDPATKCILPWRILTNLSEAKTKQAQQPKKLVEVERSAVRLLTVEAAEIALDASQVALTSATSALSAAKAKESGLRVSLRETAKAIAALDEAVQASLTKAVLEGRAIPTTGDQDQELAQLRRKAQAIGSAIPLAAQGVATCTEALDATRQDMVSAALDWAASMHQTALAEARRMLALAAPALAQLVALDAARDGLTGSSFQASSLTHPGLLAPGRLVRRLLRDLPPLLIPTELRMEPFEKAVSKYKYRLLSKQNEELL